MTVIILICNQIAHLMYNLFVYDIVLPKIFVFHTRTKKRAERYRVTHL